MPYKEDNKTNTKKVYFDPSTIETIDKAVLSFIKGLNLFANTNDGFREVPIIWGSAERSFQVKNNQEIRDEQGLLKLPILTIMRTSIVKDMASKGVFQGNVPEENDNQGGSVVVARTINQEKTRNFANATSKRLFDQDNYPYDNQKIVYRTISAPMPVNITVNYEINLRTEYQEQMNHLMLPFITKPGTINYVSLQEKEHRYEGFIDGNFNNQNNLGNYSSEERRFETKINLRVVGYLVGETNNRERPHYAIRENFVEVKIPKERVIVDPEEWDKY